MKFDWLIVGAGFTGSVIAERIASQLNKKVIVIDQRNHIGGNAYDFYNDFGVLVHKYGPHIFHTNSKRVWEYLSQFTEWRLYEHHVLANIEGKKVPIPFNLNSIYQLFPQNLASRLENILIQEYEYGKKVPILKLKEHTSGELGYLAEYIYEKVFKGYTMKQWGYSPEELDDSVTARVPVYISRDNRYFQDKYQGLPSNGYTNMFNNILNHPNIKIMLNTKSDEVIDTLNFEKMVWTGPIDEYFNFKHGNLPYRSLYFDHKTYNEFPHQECAQVNYPNNYDFTRITEFAQLTGQKTKKTTVAIEYSQEHVNGKTTPYYPIPKDEYNDRYKKYLNESKMLENVIFAGRLAEYKYYNMDQVTARALSVFDNKINI